jgi:hypothetical protein
VCGWLLSATYRVLLGFARHRRSSAAVHESAVHAVVGLTHPARVPAMKRSAHIDEHWFVHEQVKLRTV